jgi:hypothetical protein
MHQLLAHDPLVNPTFLTGKFVDGLRDEICVVVMLHRPKDLDTASALAIWQEEVLLGRSPWVYKRLEHAGPKKTSSKYLAFSLGPTYKLVEN